jgi:hypothetical protein
MTSFRSRPKRHQRSLDHTFLTVLDPIVAAASDFDQQHREGKS